MNIFLKVGVNCEHSWADAPIMGHMWESVLAKELKLGYDDNGNTKGVLRMKEEDLPDPSRLKWDFNKKVKQDNFRN